jgi:hypothetical protein
LNLKEAMAIERAVAAANALLEQHHPQATRPSWFASSVAQSARMAGAKVEVRHRVERMVPLKPNQAWEESATGPRLIETDATTGQRRVLLTRDPGEFIDLFTVVFEPESGAVTVTEDCDFAAIDPAEIEVHE